MKLISHRGNLHKSIPYMENTKLYISLALLNCDIVEVDVWYKNNKLWLGHDEPKYTVDITFLYGPKMLVHAKNHEAFELLLYYNEIIHSFWHENDAYTLSSKGIPIVYPGKPLIRNCILMYNKTCNYTNEELKKCYGICADNIMDFVKN